MGRLPVVAVAALLLGACQTDPVTGKPYYSPLGQDYASQDRSIRQAFLTELRVASDGGLLPEPELAAVCDAIVQQLGNAVPPEHRRGFRYHFHLSASPEINAYTYGGGRLHCHLGLLARCRDAAEFAGVMAHEIGHNSHDHIGQELGRGTLAGSIVGLGGLAGRPGQGLAERVGGLLAGVTLVQYTRRQERQSDDRAVDYTRAAGYDPDGIARFLAALERDFGADIRAGGPQLFQSHPFPRNRVERIRRRIAKQGGVRAGAVRSTPQFDAVAARAREILPYYQALYEALGRDEMDGVLAAAEAGIAALPRHPQFHFWKAIVHEARREREPALEALRKADRLDSTNVLIALVHALLEFDSQDYGRAEGAATEVLSILPALPAGYLIRGVSRLKLGRSEEAYRDFDQFMRRTPPERRRAVYELIRSHAPEYVYSSGVSS
ncbi:MAG: M48 family metalloprotease [Planctomycetota bacterium]